MIRLGVCDDVELAAIEKDWARSDWLCHRGAANASSLRDGAPSFAECLASQRKSYGIPQDRPELTIAEYERDD